jgi:hypothetical protein
LSEKQLKGAALEELTYNTLRDELRQRLSDQGTEKRTKNGLLWIAGLYRLFWNKQVVKEGEYFKGKIYKGKRLADIVLCDLRLSPPQWVPTIPDPTAVLAIELKNTNLNYQWTKAWLFDRDVMKRFLWGFVEPILRIDIDNSGWEKYATQWNLFPNAVKLLITPKFAYHSSALKESPIRLHGFGKEIVDYDRKRGIIPLSNSEKGKIEWRIKRLGLQVHELGYQPLPNVPTPHHVIRRMKGILRPYLDKLAIDS